MSTNVATPPAAFDASEAAFQGAGESTEPATPAAPVAPAKPEKDAAEPPTADEKEEQNGETSEEEGEEGTEEEGTEEGAAPKPETPEKPEEGKEGEEGKGKPKPDKPDAKKPAKPAKTTYKIGNREFATSEDAIAEAHRVVGHNAQLAGDLKKAQDASKAAETGLATRDARIKELEDANRQWDEWFRTEKGEPPIAKEIDPAKIADQVVERIQKSQQEKEERGTLEKELETVQAAANWDDVAEVVEKISDKINPLTDKHFTPREAYRFACKELGLENQLDKKPESPAAPEKKKEPAKAPTAAARSAAARPGGGAAPKPTKKAQRDDIDAMLDGDI